MGGQVWANSKMSVWPESRGERLGSFCSCESGGKSMFKFAVKKATPPKVIEANKAMMVRIERSAKVVMVDFKSTTQHWKHEVNFVLAMKETAGEVGFLIYTLDKIYHWVTLGTKRHRIVAGYYTGKSMAKALTIRESKPKTQPGNILSGTGYRGPVVALRREVMHPGTKPREFEKKIFQKHHSWLVREFEEAFGAYALASGHKM